MAKKTKSFNLRAQLYLRFRWLEKKMLNHLQKSKYSYLTLTQIRVFAFLRDRDITISEMAKLLNISRQAAQKTISQLQDYGLIELIESPANLSAKLIKLTEEGRKLKAWSKRATAKSEKDLASRIGAEKVGILKEILNTEWDKSHN